MVDTTTVLVATYLLDILSYLFFFGCVFVVFVIFRQNVLKKLSYFKFMLAAIFGLAYVSSGNAFLSALRITQYYNVPMFANLTQLQCGIASLLPQTGMIYLQAMMVSLGAERLYAVTFPVHYRIHGEICFKLALAFCIAMSLVVGVVQLAVSSPTVILSTCSTLKLATAAINTRNFTRIVLFAIGFSFNMAIVGMARKRMKAAAKEHDIDGQFQRRQAATTRAVMILLAIDAVVALSAVGQIVGTSLVPMLDTNSSSLFSTICSIGCLVGCVSNLFVFSLRTKEMREAFRSVCGCDARSTTKVTAISTTKVVVVSSSKI